MRVHLLIILAVFSIVWFAASPVFAKEKSYAIIIGNNSPPSENGDELAPLRYADDDAVRFYWFFKRFTPHVHLLTMLDTPTRARYQRESFPRLKPPTFAALKSAVSDVARQIRVDRQNGVACLF